MTAGTKPLRPRWMMLRIGRLPWMGRCSPSKAPLYRFFSLRKLLALLYHLDHLTSQESADPDAASKPIPDRCWGGGIRINYQGHNLLLSVSGLPWKCDEAVCVITAWVLGWIEPDQVSEYARRSGNEIIGQLYDAIKAVPGLTA